MNHEGHPDGSQSGPDSPVRPAQDRSALLTRGGLTVLIIIAVIYLLTSHWLHVLDALPYVFVVGMLAMHLFGHGGHGGHGSHGGHGDGHDGSTERRAGNGD